MALGSGSKARGSGSKARRCLCNNSKAFINAPPGSVVACKRPKFPPGYESKYNRKLPDPDIFSDVGGRARLAHEPITMKNGKKYGRAPFLINPDTDLYDGLLKSRGKITARVGAGKNLDGSDRIEVYINNGQKMTVDGETYVYVFFTNLDGKGTDEFFSGWMKQNAVIEHKDRVENMQGFKPKIPPIDPKKDKSYSITGGDLKKYKDLKVVSCVKCTETNIAANDYLSRPGGYVNIIYALPRVAGISTTTMPIKDEAGKPVKFYRSAKVKPVEVLLYKCESNIRQGHMTFVYGYVEGPIPKTAEKRIRRYGWIAWEALGHPASQREPPK